MLLKEIGDYRMMSELVRGSLITERSDMANPLYEDENENHPSDPDEMPVKERKLFTQPYDINVRSLIDQIEEGTLHLRPLSDRPRFQRKYVWTNRFASLLIESILLNIPIPPCYFSQNEKFELDVIDGQQRIFSIFRYIDNQFSISGLEVISELNGKRFHQLDRQSQRKIETHTLRAVIITNDSHPEIQFDVFERLNTNTTPLNAQELRNCMYRGRLNDLLSELTQYKPWLEILGRSLPDKRLRDEELILRFFGFRIGGLSSYRTPQKHWLNEIAKNGRFYSDEDISSLEKTWKNSIDNCLEIFQPRECFRRIQEGKIQKVVNRALMDLTLTTMSVHSQSTVKKKASKFHNKFIQLFDNEEFQDLISRAIDHKSRTIRRFEIWNDSLVEQVF